MAYGIDVEFAEDVPADEVGEWLTMMEKMFPEGTELTFTNIEEYREAELLTGEDIGRTVRFDSPDGGVVSGKLEAIYPAGRHEVSVALIVNGTAHVLTYGIVYLSE